MKILMSSFKGMNWCIPTRPCNSPKYGTVYMHGAYPLNVHARVANCFSQECISYHGVRETRAYMYTVPINLSKTKKQDKPLKK